ncbi:hypothetical protein T265_05697 [Opisthorchis viverrini]|uniref:Uncharacterized protein n=1 Tax=Opisthorchis viverrini TaxID=6198 RepID=A0A074ZIT4_OPIVI|nr:hypothetical protein T265_05697 [Opisthorchis viverrini]KER27233.1 hypothetical protein T265_05697 [Opisthorchis viverrini]
MKVDTTGATHPMEPIPVSEIGELWSVDVTMRHQHQEELGRDNGQYRQLDRSQATVDDPPRKWAGIRSQQITVRPRIQVLCGIAVDPNPKSKLNHYSRVSIVKRGKRVSCRGSNRTSRPQYYDNSRDERERTHPETPVIAWFIIPIAEMRDKCIVVADCHGFIDSAFEAFELQSHEFLVITGFESEVYKAYAKKLGLKSPVFINSEIGQNSFTATFLRGRLGLSSMDRSRSISKQAILAER